MEDKEPPAAAAETVISTIVCLRQVRGRGGGAIMYLPLVKSLISHNIGGICLNICSSGEFFFSYRPEQKTLASPKQEVDKATSFLETDALALALALAFATQTRVLGGRRQIRRRRHAPGDANFARAGLALAICSRRR